MVYFYAYAHSKNLLNSFFSTEDVKPVLTDIIDVNEDPILPKPTSEAQDSSIFYKHMAVSFVGSGFAEFLSLAFYYPFDLIKTRMQVNNTISHRYNGVLDATLKIMDESKSLTSTVTKTWREKAQEKWRGFRNLYKGGLVFGLSYTAYTAVQFSLFETALLYLEKYFPI
jgi:hypothetical protein